MPVVSSGSVVPGSGTSTSTGARFGRAVVTFGTRPSPPGRGCEPTPERGAVAPARRGARSTNTATMTARTTRRRAARRDGRPRALDDGLGGVLTRAPGQRRLTGAAPQPAVHDGDEEQGGEGGQEQPADDDAAERRILLAALPETERHRQHAEDHRHRGHEHRTQAHDPGVERGARARPCPPCRWSFAKVTSRMELLVATPMHMIAPISAGTEMFVCVSHSIHSDAGDRARQRHQDDQRIEPATGSSRP